jgi:hypothetical protein
LRQLDAAAIRGPLLINAVIYAELSVGYSRIEQVERVISDSRVDFDEIDALRFYDGALAQRSLPRLRGRDREGAHATS